MVTSVTLFLSVTLLESATRNALLGSLLNNTEVYLVLDRHKNVAVLKGEEDLNPLLLIIGFPTAIQIHVSTE
jgi:hypothetical protein